MKRVCIFCGSSPGSDPIYMQTAQQLGQVLVNSGYGLVYGGGLVGLMGTLAKTVLENYGEVIGVIPKDLVEREVGFTDLKDLRVVENMHERKKMMYDLSDGFIALPGGYGTLDEIFEALTWGQLGIHKKPCALLNINHYFDKLIEFLITAVSQGFIANESFNMLLIEDDPTILLKKMEMYKAPEIDKALHALKLNNATDINK